MFIFDTTAIIELFRRNESLKSRIEYIGDDFVSTSISYFEIFSKIYHKKLKKEVFYEIFCKCPGLSPRFEGGGREQQGDESLYRKCEPVNLSNIMISEICLTNGADGIITKDVDFRIIEEVGDLEVVFF